MHNKWKRHLSNDAKKKILKAGKRGTETNKKKWIPYRRKYENNPNICPWCKSSIPYEKRRNTFCSHSCSTKSTRKRLNRENPPLKPTWIECPRCGIKKRFTKKGKHCRECKMALSAINLGESNTLADCRANYARQKYQKIRNHAHRMAKNVFFMDRKCFVCRYDIYVELCHVTPISDFQDSSTWNEINSADNIRYLCPNHHKELDLGLLNISK